jgi:hypothetical protein
LTGKIWPEALANLEQVRVCSRADQVQVVAVDFVEQEPIRFDVAVPMMFPVSAKRVVLVSRPQGVALDKKQDQLAQLGEVLSATLGEFHIALELSAANQVSHV